MRQKDIFNIFHQLKVAYVTVAHLRRWNILESTPHCQLPDVSVYVDT